MIQLGTRPQIHQGRHTKGQNCAFAVVNLLTQRVSTYVTIQQTQTANKNPS